MYEPGLHVARHLEFSVPSMRTARLVEPVLVEPVGGWDRHRQVSRTATSDSVHTDTYVMAAVGLSRGTAPRVQPSFDAVTGARKPAVRADGFPGLRTWSPPV